MQTTKAGGSATGVAGVGDLVIGPPESVARTAASVYQTSNSDYWNNGFRHRTADTSCPTHQIGDLPSRWGEGSHYFFL